MNDVLARVTRATMYLPWTLNQGGGRRLFFCQFVAVRMLSKEFVFLFLILWIALGYAGLSLGSERFTFGDLRIVVCNGSVSLTFFGLPHW